MVVGEYYIFGLTHGEILEKFENGEVSLSEVYLE